MYSWLVLLHILGALLFFMSHGAAAAMAFRLRREQNRDRLCAILELSGTFQPLMYGSLLLLLAAGIAAGFMGNWWVQGWIGVSLALLILLSAWMTFYALRHYVPLRVALGLRNAPNKPIEIASDAEISARIKAANPLALLIPGLGVTAIILYLMIFKPF